MKTAILGEITQVLDIEDSDVTQVVCDRIQLIGLLDEIDRLKQDKHEIFAELRQKDEIIADREWSLSFAVAEIERMQEEGVDSE